MVDNQPRLLPGPIDPSMLTFQHRHRSRSIWTDRDFDARIKVGRYDGQTVSRAARDPRMLEYLRVAGFYGVAHLTSIKLDHALIAALIERWRPEVHAFHMPFGEVGITLQDVEVLFGLKVDGIVVTGRDRRPISEWKAMCRDLLGFTPLDQFMTMSKINSTAVPGVAEITAYSTDEDVRVATRILIFHLLGGFLFSETTKKDMKLFLLPFIEDFELCGQYSWGSAVLAYLYRALCRGADHNTSTMCGCLLLLQIWAWERLPIVRPKGVLPQQSLGDLPLAARWLCPHSWGTVPNHVVRAYRDQLDRVVERMFEFTPYEHFLPNLPYYCKAGEVTWTAQVPLIFFYIVEYHYPARFCRQFNSFQDVPVDVQYSEELHTIDGRSGKDVDWAEKHRQYLELWKENLIIPMIVMNDPMASDAYRAWYHRYGRRLIGNPAHRRDEGFVQCAASLNDTMHFIRDLNLRVEESYDDPTRHAEIIREIRIRTRAYLQGTDYGYLADVPVDILNDAREDEPFLARRKDLRREREYRRGLPGYGGRRMRAHNAALQAEADRKRQESEDDDDDDEGESENAYALALIPIQ